ncbi:MAG: hypothetical protein VCB42_02945, partial [Myxococcota bacterium]
PRDSFRGGLKLELVVFLLFRERPVCFVAQKFRKVRPVTEPGAALRQLTREERMLLLRFVCSFAWVDLKIRPEEREMVARLVRRMELDEDEKEQVFEWLKTPPSPESVDPHQVPRAHRVLFLREVESVVSIDREITPEERESVILFGQLIRSR